MRWLVFLVALLFTSPAFAQDWHRAESAHYVVHAELAPEELTGLVQDLEAYRLLLQEMLPSDVEPGRKLQIYLERRYNRIVWANTFAAGGITWAGAEFVGSFARYDPGVVPQLRSISVQFALTEHHVASTYLRTTPPWFRVGVNAALGTSLRDAEGNFLVGLPNDSTPYEERPDASIIEQVLTTPAIPGRQPEYGLFYLRSREIMRVIMFDPAFAGRLDTYLAALSRGASLEEAAPILGDFGELADKVLVNSRDRNPTPQVVAVPEVAPMQVAIRPMTEDEIALVADRFARMVGHRARSVARRTRRLSQRFPDSAEVWFEYAAAEYALVRRDLFGGEPLFNGFGFSNNEIVVSASAYSDRFALAAVDRALELDPDHAPALVLKSEILLARLLRADEDEDLSRDYAEVRALLEPLAATPETQPLAAAVLYQSWLDEGVEPPPEALEWLGRAFNANRGVEELRYAYASALSRVGEARTAELLLLSMLSDPRYRNAALRALAQLRTAVPQ